MFIQTINVAVEYVAIRKNQKHSKIPLNSLKSFEKDKNDIRRIKKIRI